MNKTLALFMLITLVSCNNGTTPVTAIKPGNTAISGTDNLSAGTMITSRILNDVERYRIRPSVELTNDGDNQTEITLGTHKIHWLDNDYETKINIDDDVFSLKHKTTLNIVWNNKDDVDFSNNWDQARLFSYHGKEYIGIRMLFTPCTGIGCGVSYFLVYDVSSKTENYFGTFRAYNDLSLFDFGNDDKVDYISRTLKGEIDNGTPLEFIYKLYSADANGQFKEQKDSNGLTYSLRHIIFANDVSRADKLEQHWITPIN